MSESAMNELRAALELLRTDIAVAIPWGVLHRFANTNPLDFEHYAQIEHLWNDVWRQANLLPCLCHQIISEYKRKSA